MMSYAKERDEFMTIASSEGLSLNIGLRIDYKPFEPRTATAIQYQTVRAS